MAARRSAVRSATPPRRKPHLHPLDAEDSLAATLLDTAPSKIVFVDAAGTIRYVNRAAASGFAALQHLLDCPAGRLIGQPVAILGTPDGDASWSDACARPSQMHCTLGSETLSIRTIPVSDARHAGTLLTWSVVTGVRAREERLADYAGRMAAIDNTQAVVVFAMDGTVLEANDNFLRIVGYRLDELQGRHHRMLVPPDEANGEAYRAFWARLEQGRFESQDYRRIGKDGREIWIRASYNPVPGRDGRPCKVVKFAHDVTAQRQRVDAILAGVRAARGGDLTHPVEVDGNDAIGQIGEELRDFLGDLRGSMRGIADHAQSLSTAAEELSAVSQLMSSNAEETATQAKVVSSAADQVTRSIQTAAAAAADLSGSTLEIAKLAGDATSVATTAVEVAARTNTTVAKLGESSSAIGKVVKMITAVAQQTKLLALNATIEAARAGEAGKGFAVVANEVKELAKETALATEDIGQRIEAIQSDSASVVEAIGQIGAIIADINAMQSSIAGAVEEQTLTTNGIRRNAVDAASGSDEITHNIAEVARAAQSTTSGASDTQVAALELARMASALQELVGRFRC